MDHSQHKSHHAGAGARLDRHAGHSTNAFKRKFWISLVVTVPVVILSPAIQEIFGYSLPEFPGSRWVSAVLGSFIFFYGGSIFIKSAWSELRARRPGMMTLIAVAIIAAYFYSLATTFGVEGMDFFWELSTLVTVMLLGHWLEMRAVSQTQGALKSLATLLPDMAEHIDPKTGHAHSMPVYRLKVGDMVLVRPGAKIPADGFVVEGQSEINESLITGESKPVVKVVRSNVIAGSINGAGSLKVRVSGVGEKTALAGIMRLVAQAQASKSRAQLVADRAAFALTIVALVVGIGTFVVWVFVADVAFALERGVSVLVIACPHALGLAVPLVATISTTLAASRGVLVRERRALEAARQVDVVLFDKTGTLTRGEQSVSDIFASQGSLTSDQVLTLAAAVESESEHSLARAVVRSATKRQLAVPLVQNFEALAGQGAQAMVDGVQVTVGNFDLAKERRADIPPDLVAKTARASREGKTLVYVLRDNRVIGVLALADQIRSESREAVQLLQKMGVRVAMLTGDSSDVAQWVARDLGITEYFAAVKPDQKAQKVSQLQRDGSRVVMVGDGINDAPALTQADIGIAIGAGTDVAIESAGIVLIKNDPRDVVKVIRISRATYKKMQQNLFWATGYNVVAIPLAAGVLAGVGIFLAPAVGALLMSVSTIVVALNAQLLRRLTV
jgi:Cu2+-exporting ATPase